MNNEFQNKIAAALESLENGLEPDSYTLFDTWDDQDNYEIASSKAEKMFYLAHEYVSNRIKTNLFVLKKGDPRIPTWLPKVEGATIWNKNGHTFVLYWHYDEPFMVDMYAFNSDDSNHRMVKSKEFEDKCGLIYYGLSVDAKIELIKNVNTDPDTLWVIFEYARCYPSQAIHDAIKEFQDRKYGDHKKEWILESLGVIQNDINESGERFPDP